MSDETPAPARAPGGTPAVAAKSPRAKKPAPPPPRELPDYDGIGRWIAGEDYPLAGALFEGLTLKKFDALVAQIKKEELLPQHWQVIARLAVPEGAEFDAYYEVGRLRVAYRDQELSRRRLGALRAAWEELRGKQPALWSASDLFAAMRRILEKKRDVAFYDLLTAARDVWSGLDLPHGREQLEVLWAVLNFVRSKTRK